MSITRSDGPSMRFALGQSSSENTWRKAMVSLYDLCGRPAVAGYPAEAVQATLSGGRKATGHFAEALVAACATRIVPDQFTARGLWVGDSLVAQPDVSYGVLAANLARHPSIYGAFNPTGSLNPVDILNGATPAERGAVQPTGGGPRPVPARRVEPHPVPAPTPESAATPAQFVELMGQLRDWSNMSLRQIEEASRKHNNGRDWVARSSLADALKRDRLPRPDLLAAFTLAVGLAPGDRARWEAVRQRLAGAGDRPPADAHQETEVPTATGRGVRRRFIRGRKPS